ncbi:fumarylacetoacetate hydrolase family protein [Paraburkholderia sp. JHI869]|uniref:fumarylacetoacetate hydrolase family protein n=1 Tax=Paraburkholderia sp. JHI869 TaxID=3112959 RepID=UPI00317F28EA
MRLASYVLPDGVTSYGLVDGNTILDASATLRAAFPNVVEFASSGGSMGDFHGAQARNFNEVVLLPPVDLDKIICVGLNYLSHIIETGRDVPAHPAIFTRHPNSVVGHGQPLIAPRVSDRFDFEGELAIVIGKRGHHISAREAMNYVAGYTCFNDGSIRDYQRHTSQYWAGKNFDRSGSIGPWLVTVDEMPNIDSETIVTRLNGLEMQRAQFSDLAIKIPDLIEYVSSVCELSPGDVIATGTPGGVGAFRNPPVFMKPGDFVEIEISRIGTLSNVIEAGRRE